MTVISIFFVLFLSTTYAQYGSRPYPSNMIIKDDGALVEGNGRILDLRENISATWDSLEGAYHVKASPAFTADSIITDTLTVNNDATIGGDLTVSGTITGYVPYIGAVADVNLGAFNLTADSLIVNDDITIADYASVGGDLGVTRDALITEDIYVGDDATVDGELDVISIATDTGEMITLTPGSGTVIVISEDDKICGGDYGESHCIDFDDGGDGKIDFKGVGGSNNEALRMDFETTADEVLFTSPSGAGLTLDMAVTMPDDKYIGFGDSTDAKIGWDTQTAYDNLQLGLATPFYFSVMEDADIGLATRDPAGGAAADPTIRVYGMDESSSYEYIEMAYSDSFTAGFFRTGLGDMYFQSQTSVSFLP